MKWIQVGVLSMCVIRKYLYITANGVHGQLQYSKQLTILIWTILSQMCMHLMTLFGYIFL